MVDLRKSIAERMVARGVTQAHLAKLSGTLQHKISNYLSGVADMRGETIERMMVALDLEVRPAVRRHKRRKGA